MLHDEFAASLRLNDNGLWLWVPAFAGTTAAFVSESA
jgi:hypothetical protein